MTVTPVLERTIDTCSDFAHSCVQTATIGASLERTYRALHQLADWPRFLPHVLETDIQYDDGQYQEFLMTVRSETDSSELRVRSIRNCRPGLIEFFQPEPPHFLLHHGGIWRFSEEGPEHCQVRVTHVWNLHPEIAPKVCPATDEATTEEQVERMLAAHSRLALDTWRTVLEKGGRR